MSKLLTKKERKEWQRWIDTTSDDTFFDCNQMQKALDKIDRLEQELRLCMAMWRISA